MDKITKNQSKSLTVNTSITHLDSHQYPTIALDLLGNPVTNTNDTTKDVILVVDVSGSMANSIDALRATVVAVGRSLNSGDRLAIVEFEKTATCLMSLQSVNYDNLEHIASQIIAKGQTNMSDGIEVALRTIKDGSQYNLKTKYTFMMMLSDGYANAGCTNPEELIAFTKSRMNYYLGDNSRVTFHSLGYTDGHDPKILALLPTCSNFSTGMYYILNNKSDIASAAGDCLGSTEKFSAYDITVRTTLIDEDGIDYEHVNVVFNTGDDIGNVGTLVHHEKNTLVIYTSGMDYPDGARIKLNISYVDNDNIVNNLELIQEIPDKHVDTNDQEYYHVLVHHLRVKFVGLMEHLLDPAGDNSYMKDQLEDFHEELLDNLLEIQTIESHYSVEDEGILNTLERDTGQALESFDTNRLNMSNSIAIRLRQFLHEHKYQKSGSSRSNIRNTYQTPQQRAALFRFLKGVDGNNESKANVPIEEVGLSDEIIEKRLQMEEEVCFISFDNWRECQLGIGLLVHPRTSRERYRKLMPVATLVEDYISSESYNGGVRVNLVKAELDNIDRENDDEEEHMVLPSTSRGRINAWIPIYINETNWKSAKFWATSAISIIATQFNDLFQPIYALKVCSKLMIQSVVKFTLFDEVASEKAVQMYCDIHRVFLAMADEYPEIKTTAEEALSTFIENPKSRLRATTPDLGDLIQYLTITDKYSWEDIKEPYIIEAVRRNALHIGHVNINTIEGEVDGILSFWEEATNGGRVTMFNVLFNKIVASPEGKTIQDIKDTYDIRWGRITNQQMSAIKQGFDQILQISHLPEIFAYFGLPNSKEIIAETILWGIENKDDFSSGPKYRKYGLPKELGENYQTYLIRKEIYQQANENPMMEVEQVVIQPKKRVNKSTGLAEILKIMNKHEEFETSLVSIHSETKRCEAARNWEERKLEWKPPQLESNPDHTLIFARYTDDFTEEQFLDYLKPTSVEITMIKNLNGKSQHYGFITFESHEEAANFLYKSHYNPKRREYTRNIKVGNELVFDWERGRTDPLFQFTKWGYVHQSDQ
eukprot:TRINITY_DN8280_c0_g1_i1.p1 TRINITY_DN8280_c0_g1~~TRINITY_DN8280_c0_g1_i1.p1  ORF type:complete len:1047 (-),score=246.98 TRINITY_DN8280_c0_g1_i1:59-3199(-)